MTPNDPVPTPSRFPVAALAALAGGLVCAVALRPASPTPDLAVLLSWSWLLLLAGGLAWRDRAHAPAMLTGVALMASMAAWLTLKHSNPAHSAANWFFLLDWFPRDVEKVHRGGWFVFLTAALVSLGLFLTARRVRPAGVAVLLLVWGSAHACREFFKALHGGVIYTDDHPSFLYRMHVLMDAFPSLTYWSPWWNGGAAETAAVSSGIALQAPVWMPFAFLFGLETVQPLYMAFTMFLLTPALAMLAVRWFGGGAAAVAAGGLLAMASSHHLYLWALHMGTLGAAFAMPFIPAVAGLVYRILNEERPSFVRRGLPLVVLLWGALSWPPSVMMLAPVGLGFLFCCRGWRARNLAVLVGAGLLAGALLFPAFLAKASNPAAAKLLAQATPPINWATVPAEGAARLHANLAQLNPAVLFLGLLGCVFLPDAKLRRFLLPALAVFVLLAGWGEVYKPQLQLTRSVIVLGLLAAVPAALWIGRWLDDPAPAAAPLKAAAVGLLLVSARAVGDIAGNQGPARFEHSTPELREFATWIHDHVPEDARLLFAGPAVHGYGRGHVAYLPVWTGRAMVACDYYHFGIKQVEYDMPPKPFRVNDEAFLRYMDLFNVSHVATYHADKRKVMERNPQAFRKVATLGPKQRWALYEVNRKPNWFLEGSGRVRQAVDRLEVTPDDPKASCVIKFNWNPGLKPLPPATAEPFEAGPGVTFFRLHPNGATTVVLER